MAKAELKTRPTEVSVAEFLAAITDERRRADSLAAGENGAAPIWMVPGSTPRVNVPATFASAACSPRLPRRPSGNHVFSSASWWSPYFCAAK